MVKVWRRVQPRAGTPPRRGGGMSGMPSARDRRAEFMLAILCRRPHGSTARAAAFRRAGRASVISTATGMPTGNGTSSCVRRCAAGSPRPCGRTPTVLTSAGTRRLARPCGRLSAPAPSRWACPDPSRSSCRRPTSCSRWPRPAEPPPSATRRASRSSPRCGGRAAAAWPCMPTCLRVPSRSPARVARNVASLLPACGERGHTGKGGWNGRRCARSREMIEKRGSRGVVQRKRTQEPTHPAAGLGGRGL